MKQFYDSLSKHIAYHGLFYICFLLLTPIYVMWLSVLPIEVHGDEANTALYALQILHTKTLIGVSWYDLPYFSFLPHLIGMLLFGKSIFGDRMGSVIFGVGTLPFFYAFVTNWYKRRIGIIATIFLATSNTWLALSRIGIAYVQSGFLLIATLYFLSKTYQTKRIFWAITAGVTLGLSLYAYYASRIIPLIIFPIILGTFFIVKHKKIFIKQTILIGITMFCIMLPQLVYFAQHPVAFSSRTKEVFVFSNDISVKEWKNSQYGNASMTQIILTQMKKAVQVENGDTGGQYGYKGWLLDPITICLFLFGLVVAVKKGRRKFFFLLYWFLFAFIAGVILTIDPIFVPRFVIGLPVIFIFSALGFDYLFNHVKKIPYIQGAISLLILLIIIFWNLHAYFVDYPQQSLIGKAGDRNALNATKIAYYINTLPSDYHILFLTPPNLYADFATLQFLSPQTKRFNVQDPPKFTIYKNCPANTVYIIYPSYEEKYQELRNACPYATFFVATDPQGAIEYYVLQTTRY